MQKAWATIPDDKLSIEHSSRHATMPSKILSDSESHRGPVAFLFVAVAYPVVASAKTRYGKEVYRYLRTILKSPSSMGVEMVPIPSIRPVTGGAIP